MGYDKKESEANKYVRLSRAYSTALRRSADRLQGVNTKLYETINYLNQAVAKYRDTNDAKGFLEEIEGYKTRLSKMKKELMKKKGHPSKPKKEFFSEVKSLDEVLEKLERAAAVILLSLAIMSVLDSLFNKSSVTGYIVLSEGLKISNLFILNFAAFLIIAVVLLPSKAHKFSKKVAKKTR